MPDRPTLVLLHGFPMDGRLWDRVLPRISERFRILAPDLPGFGGSPPLDRPLTMPTVADWLDSLLRSSAIEPPITLCGLSMGGYIALEFAARHEHWLGRLILCDTKTQLDSAEALRQRLSMSARLRQPDAQRFLEEIAKLMMPKMIAPATVGNDPEAVQLLRAMILDCDPAAVAAAQEGMAQRRDTADIVRRARFPLLCVVGEADALTPPELMRDIAESATNGTLVTIPTAGHLCPLESPDAFSEAVIRFVDETIV